MRNTGTKTRSLPAAADWQLAARQLILATPDRLAAIRQAKKIDWKHASFDGAAEERVFRVLGNRTMFSSFKQDVKRRESNGYVYSSVDLPELVVADDDVLLTNLRKIAGPNATWRGKQAELAKDLMAEKDVFGVMATGCGKTAA